MDNKWFYFAVCKGIIDGEVFLCEFPEHTSAAVGDRVMAVYSDGTALYGDIIFKNMEMRGNESFMGIINNYFKEVPVVRTYWERFDIPPKEESNE